MSYTLTSIEHLDLYSNEVLEDPYPAFRRLRELGPAVWMPKHQAYAIPRYRPLRRVLADYETFSSAQGVSLSESANRMMAGTVLATDPPGHDCLRSVLAEELGPHALRRISNDMQKQADVLVDKLCERKTFDAVHDFARVFPLSVVVDLIGLPEEGRDQLLDWADATFNTFGPENQRAVNAGEKVAAMMAYAFQTAVPGNLPPRQHGCRNLRRRRARHTTGRAMWNTHDRVLDRRLGYNDPFSGPRDFPIWKVSRTVASTPR